MSYFNSLRFRLIFFTFLIEAIMLSLLVANSTRLIDNYLTKQAEHNLEDIKYSFNSSLASLLAMRDYASIDSLLNEWVVNKNIAYMVITKNDQIIISAGKIGDSIPQAMRSFSDEKSIFDTKIEIEYEGQSFGTLHFGVKTDFLTDAKNDLLSQSLLIALSEILLSAILLFMMGLYLTKNLVKLTEASKQIEEGRYDLDLHVKGDDEVSILAASFASMADEIKQKIEELKEMNTHLSELVQVEVEKVRQRDEIIYEHSRQKSINELLINIAHQWRQPLNAISLVASNIGEVVEYEQCDKEQIEQCIETIINESSHLSSLISSFTSFYRKPTISTFSIKEPVLRAFEIVEKESDGLAITLDAESAQERIESDQKILYEIFLSLFHNIIDVAKLRNIEEVSIVVSCDQTEEQTLITVQDNCGGIEPEILPKIFDPYSTTNFKSANKGLGLYITSNLVKYILQGRIEAENSKDGAQFKVIF